VVLEVPTQRQLESGLSTLTVSDGAHLPSFKEPDEHCDAAITRTGRMDSDGNKQMWEDYTHQLRAIREYNLQPGKFKDPRPKKNSFRDSMLTASADRKEDEEKLLHEVFQRKSGQEEEEEEESSSPDSE
jgi:hypothetical protein